MAGIVFADAWMWSPFVMLLVLAGLVSVPKYLYEAAAIDRVSGWRRFWTITFPYIRGLLMLALLFRTIEAFKLFDVVFLLTDGGLGTETIAIYVYRVAFQYVQDQRATALAYILLFTVIVLTNLYLYLANRRAKEVHEHRPRPSRRPRRSSRCRCERLGIRRASGVGEAGWGRTLAAAIVSLDLFLPGSVDHHDGVQDATPTRWRSPAEVLLHADAREFVEVFSRADFVGGAAQDTGFELYFFNSIFIAGTSVLLALDHRHARRLRLLALSAQGQRHLSLHHPDDAHAAGRSSSSSRSS